MASAMAEVSRLLYGRKHGRKLRPGQQALYDAMLPALRLELPGPGTRLDPAFLFSHAKRDEPGPGALLLFDKRCGKFSARNQVQYQ